MVRQIAAMDLDEPLLCAFYLGITFLALAALKPVITARREARRCARDARERARRMHEDIAALRQSRRIG